MNAAFTPVCKIWLLNFRRFGLSENSLIRFESTLPLHIIILCNFQRDLTWSSARLTFLTPWVLEICTLAYFDWSLKQYEDVWWESELYCSVNRRSRKKASSIIAKLKMNCFTFSGELPSNNSSEKECLRSLKIEVFRIGFSSFAKL